MMPTGALVRSIAIGVSGRHPYGSHKRMETLSACEERRRETYGGAHMQQRGAYEGHRGTSIRKRGASKVHRGALHAKRGRL